MPKPAIPEHIALIMDGNGRWAKKRFLPRIMGHKAGVKTLKSLLLHAERIGVKIVTIYAFSTENWSRPQEEVGFLMKLFMHSLRRELAELHARKVHLRFIGDLSPFPSELVEIMRNAEQLTANNQSLHLNVAVNYGARAEILRAARQIAGEVHEGKLSPDQIDEACFSRFLYTNTLPDPDLLIRTSGESRLSNFLLWQLAYTELYFVDTLFPDFKQAELDKAIAWYQDRERRFGKTSEQLTSGVAP